MINKKTVSLSLMSIVMLLTGCGDKTDIEALTDDTTKIDNTDKTDTGEDSSSTPVKANWDEDGVLKILTIGNSFSDDSMEYVAKIAQSLGVEKVKLGNLYIGGCSLQTHFENAKENKSAYDYRTNEGDGWTTKSNSKMDDAILSENWDFISLQQASGSSGVADSYEPYLTDLIEHIQGIADENSRIVWNMTWAYQQDSTHAEYYKYECDQTKMYEAIKNAVHEKVETHKEIELVIPTGTSIQNARTSYIGDNLTRDGYHLTMDVGRYIAGLTFVKKLAGLDIDEVPFSPESVDEDLKKVCIESVNNALKNPFDVTASEYKNEPVYDYSDYTPLDLDITTSAFYNSTDATNFDKMITDNASLSPKFAATRKLTKFELPIGSIIEIKRGYQYRPEGWRDDKKESSRPANVSTRRVEVTPEWWDTYLYRAFNIAATDGNTLVGREEEAKDALKIYVPKEYTSSYTNLDYEKIDKAFYNATDKNNWNTPITNNATLCAKFFCTKKFTKDELPVGTILKVQEGWQYRPEAWVDDNKQTSRPANVTRSIVVVTETWWSNYIYRAFNVTTDPSASLAGLDTTGVFEIYLPIAQ